MRISWLEALDNARDQKQASRFPTKADARSTELIFPEVRNRFTIRSGSPVFTIGSCFAREIEENLADFDLPTRTFSVPKSEWPFRPSGLLNEYNPGTMYQRIKYALSGIDYSVDTIVQVGSAYADLALPGGAAVSFERAVARRDEIKKIYSKLIDCDVVIITLGLVEAWVDQENEIYLNRMPPLDVLRRFKSRYAFEVLDVSAALSLLDQAVGQLSALDKKILLTVSPVPLATTFTQQDAVIANGYSKAVLRVCAQTLAGKYRNVDYFPSYEIALSAGLSSFQHDNVHLLDQVVAKITNYMIQKYVSSRCSGET